MPTNPGAAVSWPWLCCTEVGPPFVCGPPWQSFFPVFPVPKQRCLSIVPALVISKGIICLHNSDKCVGDPTKTQYYVAVWITVGKVIVGSCVRNLEVDLIAPRNLKIRSSGARVQGDWLYMRSFYCIIPDSRCLSSMRIARHRCVCDITRPSPHLHSQFLSYKILNQAFNNVG